MSVISELGQVKFLIGDSCLGEREKQIVLTFLQRVENIIQDLAEEDIDLDEICDESPPSPAISSAPSSAPSSVSTMDVELPTNAERLSILGQKMNFIIEQLTEVKGYASITKMNCASLVATIDLPRHKK